MTDVALRSDLNRDVLVANPGEFTELSLGKFSINPPVVLAPMAGVTNAAFRALCRQFGAGLYISEMVTARALVEGNHKTEKIADFRSDETPRSLQLYGVDPIFIGEAVTRLVGEGRVDHLDLNFGCPVRKVTKRGGGAAIPAKPRLLRNIVRAAVGAAEGTPVTMKFRIGIDDSLSTFLEAGRIGEGEGCSALMLHARTAAQLYDGEARWETISELKEVVTEIPVLGNGDIWEAWDALRMMRRTGCDGVVVGRGCLGRPWLFRDLANVFSGLEPDPPPTFGGVAEIMIRHAELLVDWFGEFSGIRSFRKHTAWYTKGFVNSATLRKRLCSISSLDGLAEILADNDRDEPFPITALRVPRGKSGGRQRVSLPEGYLLESNESIPPCREAEIAISGG